MDNGIKRDYATINGLKIYYEIHGAGQPLILLHGGFMTIDPMEPLLPVLAATRQIIAVELG
ncbi:MAG TPA: alpha/beta hydrolase [Ktedonobacterales bacterium]|nr:alpha/beta hydrolase [Ktedonobacterales bacterium]